MQNSATKIKSNDLENEKKASISGKASEKPNQNDQKDKEIPNRTMLKNSKMEESKVKNTDSNIFPRPTTDQKQKSEEKEPNSASKSSEHQAPTNSAYFNLPRSSLMEYFKNIEKDIQFCSSLNGT